MVAGCQHPTGKCMNSIRVTFATPERSVQACGCPIRPHYTGLRLIHSAASNSAAGRWRLAFGPSTRPTISEPTASDSLPAIAVDGKTLRGSFDAFSDRKAAHMDVGAAAGRCQIVLDHLMVSRVRTDPPTLGRELISSLRHEGHVVILKLDAEYVAQMRMCSSS